MYIYIYVYIFIYHLGGCLFWVVFPVCLGACTGLAALTSQNTGRYQTHIMNGFDWLWGSFFLFLCLYSVSLPPSLPPSLPLSLSLPPSLHWFKRDYWQDYSSYSMTSSIPHFVRLLQMHIYLYMNSSNCTCAVITPVSQFWAITVLSYTVSISETKGIFQEYWQCRTCIMSITATVNLSIYWCLSFVQSEYAAKRSRAQNTGICSVLCT